MAEVITIISIGRYRDGGTISIKTDIGEFCIDNRIGSETKGVMFNGYPDKSEPTDIDTEIKILRLAIYHNA